MQHWLDKLTDLAALPGDEHLVEQALETVVERSGFSGYAYLNLQPSHSSAISNYHPEWQREYFRRGSTGSIRSSNVRKHFGRRSLGVLSGTDHVCPKTSDPSSYWPRISGSDRGLRSRSELPMELSRFSRWLLQSGKSTSSVISILLPPPPLSRSFTPAFNLPIQRRAPNKCCSSIRRARLI